MRRERRAHRLAPHLGRPCSPPAARHRALHRAARSPPAGSAAVSAYETRHQIELLLKNVIETARKLYCERPGPVKGHDLVQLWQEAEPYIRPLGPVNAPEITNAKATITEFQRIDPGADGFRYPLNVSGSKKNLSGAPSCVNIVLFHEAMGALANFLSGVGGELGSRLQFFLDWEFGEDLTDEQRAEMRRNYMADL